MLRKRMNTVRNSGRHLKDEELIMERISDDYNMYYFKRGEGITGMPELEEQDE